MSSSDNFDVQQKKDPTTVVTWNEYEALRDHLQRQILTATNPIHENVQNVELSLNEATETITETQQQVTDIHAKTRPQKGHPPAPLRVVSSLQSQAAAPLLPSSRWPRWPARG